MIFRTPPHLGRICFVWLFFLSSNIRVICFSLQTIYLSWNVLIMHFHIIFSKYFQCLLMSHFQHDILYRHYLSVRNQLLFIFKQKMLQFDLGLWMNWFYFLSALWTNCYGLCVMELNYKVVSLFYYLWVYFTRPMGLQQRGFVFKKNHKCLVIYQIYTCIHSSSIMLS